MTYPSLRRRKRIVGKRVDRRGKNSMSLHRGARQETPPKQEGHLWQLVVSGIILVSVVAIKLLSPQLLDTFRSDLLQLMGGTTDFVAVFSAVGKAVGTPGNWEEALDEAYVAVFGGEEITEAPVIYSESNTPDNVRLLQEVLGFDYASPLKGKISDRFGYRADPIDGTKQFHYALDIEADEGTDITAFADGTVTAVGESASLGKYVTILHNGDYATLYAHCSRITASSGQKIKLGDPIAAVGQTGRATGPHLHFELYQNTTYLNPVYYAAA